jgi:hypothetical protein
LRNVNKWQVFTTQKLHNIATVKKINPPKDDYYLTDMDNTVDDWDDMYRDAFDGNSEAEWNID